MTRRGEAARPQPASWWGPMESVANVMLLDADGRPLDPQIQAALRELLPRFRHRFLTLRDEFLVTEIFEEAGRRIQHEAAAGRVGNLGAYAWRTLRNVAVTRLRHSSLRLERATLGSHEGEVVIGSLASRDGTAEQIEANIELDEFLSSLTPRERQICLRKKAGCTSREIAMELGTSPGYVDKLFNQIRRKFEDARDRREGGPIVATSTSAQPTRTRPDVIPSG
jgi:RNA polymerase sigma factor (sigma-70 family)